MADRDQLPYLVQLLDDRSPHVREHIIRELLTYGPNLEEELRSYCDVLTHRQRSAVKNILRSYRDAVQLREAWTEWLGLPQDVDKLERACEVLAAIQYGWVPPVRLRELLDDLAGGFLASGLATDPVGLSRYLFTRQLRGNVDDYYNPLNCNLIHVIQSGKGLPISLALVFMLVGHRVGLQVEGCSVPGHFLARAVLNGREMLFDCFNRGRILTVTEVEERRNSLPPQQQHLLSEPADAVTIMTRLLHNLVNAYELAEEPLKVELVQSLLHDLKETVGIS
jgi:regulator of sirC expression with transglutaminase-like and TPR domain